LRSFPCRITQVVALLLQATTGVSLVDRWTSISCHHKRYRPSSYIRIVNDEFHVRRSERRRTGACRPRLLSQGRTATAPRVRTQLIHQVIAAARLQTGRCCALVSTCFLVVCPPREQPIGLDRATRSCKDVRRLGRMMLIAAEPDRRPRSAASEALRAAWSSEERIMSSSAGDRWG
jgi:hypothetical protein